MGQRDTTAVPMEPEVQERYVRNLLRLITWGHYVKGPVGLVLSGGAQAAFAPFHAEIEARLGEGSDLGDEDLRAWGSKLPGRTLKLCALLHLMDYLGMLPDEEEFDIVAFGEGLPLEIGRRTMERAIKIARYIIPHQVAAFEKMLGGPTLTDAERILAWARHKQVQTFSWRDARRSFSRAIQKSRECNERVGQALALLLAMGRIEQKEVPEEEKRNTGRPHSPVYIIVPNGEAE
jgi:hypothetical protein